MTQTTIQNQSFRDFTPEQKLILRNIMMSFVLVVVTSDEYHLVADGSLEMIADAYLHKALLQLNLEGILLSDDLHVFELNKHAG